MDRQRKIRGWIVLTAVLTAAALLFVGTGVHLILHSGGKRLYREHMNLAAQYLRDDNYDAAISSYWAAIAADQKNDRAYLELGRLYAEMGQEEQAQSVYLLGFRRTRSQRLGQRITNANALPADQKDVTLTDMNHTLLQDVSENTYEYYADRYGIEKTQMDQTTCQVFCRNTAMVLYFYDTDPREFDTGSSKGRCIPDEVELKDLNLLFPGMGGGMTYESLQTCGVRNLELTRDNQLHKTVVHFLMNGCDVKIEADENGNILSRTAWNRIYPQEVSQEKDCVLEGMILNAATGGGVSGAAISLTRQDDSGFSAEEISASDGTYAFDSLEAGEYQATITAEGFVKETITVRVGDEDSAAYDITISPELAEGEIRLVLTWGNTPSDLDSHLTGTSSSGQSVHVFYGDPSAHDIADLDVDCMSGRGPETTTVYDIAGDYAFYVKDYGGTGTMAASGAEVKIYVNGQEPMVVSVPADAVNVWQVCTIRNGKVTIVNQAEDDLAGERGKT